MQTGITGKLLRAWCASPSGFRLLQTLSGGGHQQRPALPLEAPPQNTPSQAGTTTAQEPGSLRHCCSCSPLLASQPDSPGRPTLAEPFMLECPGRKTPLPHVIAFRRGLERKPCLRKQHHWPAVTQPTEDSKRSSHAAATSFAKSQQSSTSRFWETGRQTACPSPGHPDTSAWHPHLPAISIGFSLFRLSLLPASEICAPKAAFKSRSVSLPVLRDLKGRHTTQCRKSTGAKFQLTSTPACAIPGPQPLNATQQAV